MGSVGFVRIRNGGAFPSFPRRGGCAPPRNCPVPCWRSRGGLRIEKFRKTTPAPPAAVASRYFLGSWPPLLGKEGNAPPFRILHNPTLPSFRFFTTPHSASIPI